MGRIVVIVCIIVLIVGGVWWWRNYHNANLYDGSVVRRDAAMETGTTTMENGQNLGEARPIPSRSDAPGTLNGDPYNGGPDDLGTQTTPVTRDPYGAGGQYASTGPYGPGEPQPRPGRLPNRGPSAPQVSYGQSQQVYTPPMMDTQVPDAPNGLRFAGSGIYEWYRQGNVTYRVNTRSGASCVMYATLDEWRKQNIYRHGCRA